LIAQRGWSRIGDAEWEAICAAVPGIAPEDLQILEIPVAPPWFGVRQHSLDELEESLCVLGEVYSRRDDLRRFCRASVIRAKDHARWASRSAHVDEAKRLLKAEMVEWMLVWLGDPALFPPWVSVRRAALTGPRFPPPEAR